MNETPRRTVTLTPDELDLAEQLALSLVMRTNPQAVVVVHGGQDMESHARSFNQGFQVAKAWENLPDDTPEGDEQDVIDEATEAAPEAILLGHSGEVIGAIILAPGWKLPRPGMWLDREGRGMLRAQVRKAD